MVTVTQTVTLAAAFMQEIKEDDQKLRLVLDRFRQHVMDRPLLEADLAGFAELAMELRDRLAFRFALEEAFGYFEDPIDVAPRLSERIEELRLEHGKLYADAAQITEDLDASRPLSSTRLASLQNACREFLLRFDRHESRENEIMLQAFNEDIGCCD